MPEKLVIKTGASFNRGSSNQEYGTPPEVIAAVEKRFGRIVHDLAASQENAVCDTFWSKEDNALEHDWLKLLPTGNLWLNCPYADIAPWAMRAAGCWQRKGFLFLLVPASVDSNWWRDFVEGRAYTIAMSPRIKFVGADQGYPKAICVAIYGYGIVGTGPQWRWDGKSSQSK